MHMPEISRQHWQAPLGVFTRSVPAYQRLNGESMTKIMQPGTMAVIVAAQPDLARQAVKGASYIGAVEPVAGSGNEEMNGGAATQKCVAAPLIVGQDFSCRGVRQLQGLLEQAPDRSCLQGSSDSLRRENPRL